MFREREKRKWKCSKIRRLPSFYGGDRTVLASHVRLLSRFTRRGSDAVSFRSPSELGSKWIEIARWPFVMGKVNLELSVVSLGSTATSRRAPKECHPRFRRRGKVCDKCKKLSGKKYSRK